MEMEKESRPKFDLKVTHRDPETGQITHTTPYTVRVIKAAAGGKTKVFERPVGSGNLFDAKGEPAGRWDASLPEGERYLKNEAHVAYKMPESKDQKLIRESIEKDAQIEMLKRELDAIKMEKDKSGAKAEAKSENKKPAEGSKVKGS